MALKEPLIGGHAPLVGGMNIGSACKRSTSLPAEATEDEVASPFQKAVRYFQLDSPVARRRQRLLFTPLGGGNAMCESLTFPNVPDCAYCHQQLGANEMRWGTGLCADCYARCPKKNCNICQRPLPKKQLLWRSGLCDRCYDTCDKNCKMCDAQLGIEEMHWRTGLCDMCYNGCDKVCRSCDQELHVGQLRWGTGLCDECYNSAHKYCQICASRIEDRQLRWNSGLCNDCYDSTGKTCRICESSITLGSFAWRTRLCDRCHDLKLGQCNKCSTAIDKSSARFDTGLCDNCYEALPQDRKLCQFCKQKVPSRQLRWGTGLCLACYDKNGKQCKLCQESLPFGQAHWGSGLCNKCYDGCERQCRMCKETVPLDQLHWGTRLCNLCFDSCRKTCTKCSASIDIGDLHWGTGLCNDCYDQGRRPKQGLSRGVRAVILAQFVFYVAPAALQPSLYLHIQATYSKPSPTAVYVFVLIAASFASMIAPVPLGFWADFRGEREVYCGITLLGGLSAVLFLRRMPAAIFALAWSLLNLPPAIRGVRATYFAKHVPPEELSRVGQLATSSGLLGGFVGPITSVVASHLFGSSGSGSDQWLDGFTASALFAIVAHLLCAIMLGWAIKKPFPKVRGRGMSTALTHSHSNADMAHACERCRKALDEQETECQYLLCNTCYDTFGGENVNFKRYSRRVLVGFCLISSLLEVSMNAGVIGTFQPIAVVHFDWGNSAIAACNFVGAGLSVLISLAMTWLRLPERMQMALAAGFYVCGVLVFTMPPLRPWRIVVGLMLGIKAQILFMAPFTAIFSRLIGRARMTNSYATPLCLAPAIGAALGTAMAPVFVSVAGTPAFTLVAAPALAAVGCIAWGWHRFEGVPTPRPVDGDRSA